MPALEKIAVWFKVNVEEEWQSAGFNLLINFVSKNGVAPSLESVSGVTPHVSGDYWEKITMDPDYSLDDYNTQWTIRHEYGHVLGFPDCYHEFYDEEQEAFVSYQLDVTNLMCSRRGHLQQTHFDEMKKAYFKE